MSNKEKKDTKQFILDIAYEKFSEKGFHHTSIDEIAKTGSLSKGAVFHYFPTKKKLYQELIHQLFEQWYNDLCETASKDDKYIDRIVNIVEHYYNNLLTEPSFASFYMDFLINMKHDEELTNFLLEVAQEYVTKLKSIIDEGIEEGSFKNIDSGSLSFFIGSNLDMLYLIFALFKDYKMLLSMKNTFVEMLKSYLINK